jgi:hypothetical protein
MFMERFFLLTLDKLFPYSTFIRFLFSRPLEEKRRALSLYHTGVALDSVQ